MEWILWMQWRSICGPSNDSQRSFEVEKPLLETGSDLQNEITIMKLPKSNKSRASMFFKPRRGFSKSSG